jgi:hypothetical protein
MAAVSSSGLRFRPSSAAAASSSESRLVPAANPSLSLEGLLTIYCVIGVPPASAEEGIRLVVPGVRNFNDVVTGANVYIKQS